MRHRYFNVWVCIALTVGVIILFNLIGGVFLFSLYGEKISQGDPSVVILINGLGQLSVMLAVPILISKEFRQNLSAIFRLEGMHDTPIKLLVFGVPMMFLAQLVGEVFGTFFTIALQQFPSVYEAVSSFQHTMDTMMGDLTSAHSVGELLVLLIGVSFIPALAEELFFRGFIQTNIERSGKHKPRPYIAIAITSILFAAMHASPLNFPGLLMLGVTLGWMAYRTNDIRVSMLAHALNNGVIVLSIYFFSDSQDMADTLTKTSKLSVDDAFQLLAFSLPLFLGAGYLFYRWSEPLHSRYNAEDEFLNRNAILESHE